MRIIMIGFLYVIGPLCSLSLTNYTNPQGFTVWKNSIIGMFIVNVTQIFLLQFLMNIASDISRAGSGNSNVIASIALYLGAFFAIIAIPSYIQSMIGGYGQGIMESMQQLKGTLGATWGMTAGLALSSGHKVVGRHNDNTGHLTGGLRGAIRGNKNQTGERIGGVANRFRAIRGGIFGKSTSDNGSNSSGGAGANDTNGFASSLNGRGESGNSSATASTSNSTNGTQNTMYNRGRQQNPVKYGGIFGQGGFADRATNAVRNPRTAVKNAYHGMADVIGIRGSGPKNWKSFNEKDGEK